MNGMTVATLILIAPCSLLLGAALQILVAQLCSARTKGILAFLTCAPAMFAVIGIVPSVRSGQAIELNLFQWDSPLALVLHVDALSVLFAFMGSSIGALVLLYSIGYMARDTAATRFYVSMLIFIGGFIGLVYSANLFIFYLCWELVGLCSFSLVGFWYTNREAVAGARKVLLMTHIAGYGLLASILVIYHRTGSALWTDPNVAHNFTTGIFILMLIALVAKSVQVPLHTWIPEAMAAPTPVSALLHAACYVTSGVYLAARMHSFGVWPVAWGATLIWIGTITMAVGVMYAMVQTDLKRMLAFSTVSQIGYMMLGIGIGTPLAITAGLLHCLNHGFFKGGLFLNAGSMQHATGTRDMNKLGGLAQKMPHTTLSWLIGIGSMMGIPLMSGFASKWMLYAAALQAGWAVPAMIAWAVSLGTVFLGAKATSAVFLGPLTEATKDAHESPPTMVWGMGLLAAGSVALGVAPQLAVNYFLNPILGALNLNAVQVTWFGLSSDTGSFSTAGGLVLAIVSLVLGGVIYAVAYAVRQTPATVAVTSGDAAMASGGGGIFTGGEPLSDQGRLTAADFSGIFLQNWHEFFRWSNVDCIYLGVWSALQAVSRGLGVLVSWMERQAAILVVVYAALILAALRWLVPGVASLPAGASIPVPQILVAACAIAATALILAALSHNATRTLAPLMVLTGVAAVVGLAVADPWLRLGLLELGALLTIPLVWQSARTHSAKLAYVAVVVISTLTLVASDLLLERGQADWARALLATSVCVKLAAVPLFFWLLKLADEVPALVLGLIIAVVDIAAFGELYVAVHASPGMFAPAGLWLGLAAATSFLAALLMLTQRSLKRLLVLSTVEDVGFLMLGLASATALGTTGALLAAVTHALAKALLFTCLSGPEAAGALEDNQTGLVNTGLISHYPVSAFGFLFGMLAMLGIPPTLGFIGRWKLYETAVVIGWPLGAIFILSSILALVAYVLALTGIWWGPASDADSPQPPDSQTKEPFLLQTTIVLLVALILVAGVWPSLLEMLHWGSL
ncbi:MAG TPA: proton-conducting transporter membrane subunit [Terracidiphilus sp.]|nr:proton-conducting transporter membrane subunit [Terracidiphilus sp.]